mmetsp:Transcript_11778/g.31777  ORF Transcript_11778/g.31777 Transcript_11778/m.31777 type:complete len:232 (+) Transcript_11778:1701-2396(+)
MRSKRSPPEHISITKYICRFRSNSSSGRMIFGWSNLIRISISLRSSWIISLEMRTSWIVFSAYTAFVSFFRIAATDPMEPWPSRSWKSYTSSMSAPVERLRIKFLQREGVEVVTKSLLIPCGTAWRRVEVRRHCLPPEVQLRLLRPADIAHACCLAICLLRRRRSPRPLRPQSLPSPWTGRGRGERTDEHRQWPCGGGRRAALCPSRGTTRSLHRYSAASHQQLTLLVTVW